MNSYYLPNPFTNAANNLDEATVAFLLAAQQDLVARRKRDRNLTIGICAIAGSVVAITLVILMLNSLHSAQIIFMVGALVLILFSVGSFIIIRAILIYPGEPCGLVRADWRLLALSYERNKIMLLDTLGSNPQKFEVFDADLPALWSATDNLSGDSSSLSAESNFLRQLVSLCGKLAQVQPTQYGKSYLMSNQLLHASMLFVWQYVHAMSQSERATQIILPNGNTLDMGAEQRWCASLKTFLDGNNDRLLTAIKERVNQQCAVASKATRSTLAPPDAVGNALLQKDPLNTALVLESINKLFVPVISSLQNQVAPDLRDIENEANRQKATNKRDFDLETARIQWLNTSDAEYDLSVRQLEDKRDDIARQMQDMQNLIRYDSAGNPSNASDGITALNTRISNIRESIKLQQQSTARSGANTVSTDETLEDLQKQVSKYEDQIHELRVIDLKLQKAKEQRRLAEQAITDKVNAHSQHIQKAQAILADIASQQKKADAAADMLAAERKGMHLGHIEKLQADKRLLLDRLAKNNTTVKVNEQITSQSIIDLRIKTFKDLQGKISASIDKLQQCLSTTKALSSTAFATIQDPSKLPFDILIPLWFVRYPRHKNWQLLAGPCTLYNLVVAKDVDLGARLDYTQTKGIFDHIDAYSKTFPNATLCEVFSKRDLLADALSIQNMREHLDILLNGQFMSARLHKRAVTLLLRV